mmetsp:Transcript_10508/g.30109  ORF Transcript_10508/g.30109 Transcript_10508/m.30109 type:complete len:260 (+) Transcript_10508:2764-3543(+)
MGDFAFVGNALTLGVLHHASLGSEQLQRRVIELCKESNLFEILDVYIRSSRRSSNVVAKCRPIEGPGPASIHASYTFRLHSPCIYQGAVAKVAPSRKLRNYRPILAEGLEESRFDDVEVVRRVLRLQDHQPSCTLQGLEEVHEALDVISRQRLKYENAADCFPNERLDLFGLVCRGHVRQWSFPTTTQATLRHVKRRRQNDTRERRWVRLIEEAHVLCFRWLISSENIHALLLRCRRHNFLLVYALVVHDAVAGGGGDP